jgi:hypothetical protein
VLGDDEGSAFSLPLAKEVQQQIPRSARNDGRGGLGMTGVEGGRMTANTLPRHSEAAFWLKNLLLLVPVILRSLAVLGDDEGSAFSLPLANEMQQQIPRFARNDERGVGMTGVRSRDDG